MKTEKGSNLNAPLSGADVLRPAGQTVAQERAGQREDQERSPCRECAGQGSIRTDDGEYEACEYCAGTGLSGRSAVETYFEQQAIVVSDTTEDPEMDRYLESERRFNAGGSDGPL